MKKNLMFYLLLSTAAVMAQPKLEDGIKFEQGNWANTLAKAKAENKIVFVDAYTTWCGPCKK
ncbi:MAG: thioredoxin domain-containing protein, partial [Schleiferiaceae bacterium]|nr:thioredoxin domain-containing protein [Schleiferiaceae bacterium]